MKKVWLVVWLSIMTVVGFASVRTAERCEKIAVDFLDGEYAVASSSLRSAADIEIIYEDSSLFVGQGGNGWVIVSKSDKSLSVLAHGEGVIDKEFVERERDLFASYGRYVSDCEQGKITATSQLRSSREKVGPLLGCYWGQTEPYNLKCPTILGYLNGVLTDIPTVTGCVSVAMAQILTRWGQPAVAPAMPGYSYNGYTVGATTASAINWNLLKPDYYSSQSDESAQSVAWLIRLCGQSAKVEFLPNGSPGTMDGALNAFKNTWGYMNATHISRKKYKQSEWENVLYKELAAGRPIMMSGEKSKESAHAFVCDGYKDGRWHINWGFLGTGNGYYSMVNLDAADSTEPANDFGDGYNMSLDAIIGLAPGFVSVDKGTEMAQGTSSYSLLSKYIESSVGSGAIEPNRPAYMKLRIKNTGTSGYEVLKLYLNGSSTPSGSHVLWMEPGETADVTLTFVANQIGTNTYVLKAGSTQIGNGSFTVSNNVARNLTFGTVTTNCIETGYKAKKLSGSNLQVSVNVTNTDSKVYDDYVGFAFYKIVGASADSVYFTTMYAADSQVKMNLASGYSTNVNVNIDVSQLQPGVYRGEWYYFSNKKDAVRVFSGKYTPYIKLVEGNVESDVREVKGDAPKKKGVWTLNGQYLGGSEQNPLLPSGVYVIDGKKRMIK